MGEAFLMRYGGSGDAIQLGKNDKLFVVANNETSSSVTIKGTSGATLEVTLTPKQLTGLDITMSQVKFLAISATTLKRGDFFVVKPGKITEETIFYNPFSSAYVELTLRADMTSSSSIVFTYTWSGIKNANGESAGWTDSNSLAITLYYPPGGSNTGSYRVPSQGCVIVYSE